jgi:RNA 3'-terminal phosphate cyclase (ATP)
LLTIDGSRGEGGGQVLRTSLALSLVTGTPVRFENIRAGRRKPGLRNQHVACVRAAAEIGGADVEGVSVGAQALTFAPTALTPGDYTFDLKTAGSTSLVLQSVLPALAVADGPSSLTLMGGTHNPLAPPFDFLDRAYLPLLARMGTDVDAELVRHGFAPSGGGEVRYRIQPTKPLAGFELIERGDLVTRRARAVVANLPEHIAERELQVVAKELGFGYDQELLIESVPSAGPGNVLLIELESEHAIEVLSAFGAKGVPAERVAEQACKLSQQYLSSSAPVGAHLADQLLLLLCLAKGGRFRTGSLSRHVTTQIDLIPEFLDVRIERADVSPGVVELSVREK